MVRIKQVIVANEGLNMSPGKLAAQVAHASIAAYEISDKDHIDAWKRAGVTKVVLGAGSETDLIEIYKRAVAAYLPTALIADEGRTEVTPGTITACGIGPAPEEQINEVTGSLQLYGKKLMQDKVIHTGELLDSYGPACSRKGELALSNRRNEVNCPICKAYLDKYAV